MNCRILHASRGRLRIRVIGPAMRLDMADVLEAYLSGLEGVQSVQVFDRTSDAIIRFREEARDRVCKALAAFSFEANLDRKPDHSSRAIEREYDDRIVLQLMGRVFSRVFLPAPVRTVIAVCKAAGYVRKALAVLAKGRLEVPVLDAAAITASLLRGDGNTAGSVMFLLKLGDTLEEWTHKKSVAELARTMALNVDKVWRVGADGQRESVPVGQVAVGELVAAGTGNLIPLDGVVASGEATVNQSSMTGESEPVLKRTGSLVYAGTVIDEGELVIEVTQPAGSGRYDRIVSMIEDSEKLKSASEDKASHLADRLVPWCFGGTLLTWLLTRSVQRAVSVLMVDFSCALKLSMPLAVLSAMKEAGRNQVSVKGGKFLEAIAEAETVVFDKTGTLTHAAPRVAQVVPFGGNDEQEMLRLAACLEEHYPHSMANAVVRAAQERGLLHEEEHAEVSYIVAHGIASRIDGEKVVIGSRHFVFEDEGATVPAGEEERFRTLPPQYSHLYLARASVLCAVICVEDPLREEAAAVLSELHGLGIEKLVMMTGDSERTAAAVARQVGVDEYYAEVLPEDKAAFIRREHEQGRRVLMIGDGVNDSPALSEADAGIAISDGAAIAREVADVTILADDLRVLPQLRRLSEALMGRIRNNYRFILSFNTALIGLGVVGLLPPAASALLHNASTIAISLRSMTPLLPE